MDIKKIILLVGALVIAGISAFAVRVLLGSNTDSAVAAPVMQVEQPDGPKVLVAQEMLPLGTIITAEHFAYQPWPSDLVQGAYFTEEQGGVEKLTGKVVRLAIPAGQPVTKRAVVGPGERGFLAAALQPGQRAVTVPLDNITGVAGFIFPGDRVDVLLHGEVAVTKINDDGTQGDKMYDYNVAETIVRNVRVLAIDQRLDETGGDGAQTGRSITFEVSPKMVEKIAVAQSLGKLSFSLRAMADSRAQLEAAIARGDITVGDDQTPDEDSAMEMAALQVIDDSGSTFTPGSEVSRFAVGPNGPPGAATPRRRNVEGKVMPLVRVTRGMNTQSVTIKTDHGEMNVPSSLLAGLAQAGANTASGRPQPGPQVGNGSTEPRGSDIPVRPEGNE
ncbi:Flp pilus assembly protein CpaB [Pacificimonas sp. WHA3]|uniref:Flp pilus assembly protein CpaB n=1 Tax=Pacificimonas pallii TaxID=2827236 RepID=A0ABS6SA42_9SPHN|nr:Flp pilus assembly protein CpaB [Pacificimonas pallii]MBV7255247.1 Flp pilus assembly protein CpaB [Pacificimonas pallii]